MCLFNKFLLDIILLCTRVWYLRGTAPNRSSIKTKIVTDSRTAMHMVSAINKSSQLARETRPV